MNIILLILLILLVLKSVYPMVLNVINPDINFENVPFSKFIIKYLHGTEFKESISWIAFLILNIYLIYKVFKINSLFKIPLIILLLYLPILFVFPINTINNIYLKLILPHNEPFIDNINEVFKRLDILINREKKRNRELKRKLGIVESEVISSNEMISDFNEMYDTDYLRNWGLFLSTIVVGVSISKIFVSSQ